MISLKGCAFSLVFLLIVLPSILCQHPQPAFQIDKPGACPRSFLNTVPICYEACTSDIICTGASKCCPTSCGGSVCTTPVTEIQYGYNLKPGFCPVNPTGPWLCTSRCVTDTDCRRDHKCCRNRCGAMACVAPQLNYS